MSITVEMPPARAQAKAIEAHGFPLCGKCRRRLQHLKQWRCPYRACRAWLRSANDPELRRPHGGL